MKTFIIDAVAVGTAVAVFLTLKPEGPIPIIIAVAAAAAAHITAEKIFGGEQALEQDPAQEKKMSGELTQELQDAATGLRQDFCTGNKAKSSPPADNAVMDFLKTITEFEKRKKALYKVIALTEYKNAAYIEHGSDVAEQNLIQLAEILRIKLTILAAIDQYDYQYKGIKDDIERVTAKARERLGEYSALLAEAGKLKDGDSEAAEKITNIIDKLEEARKEDITAFQQDCEPGVTASGKDFGI